jgi:Phosphotransferase enzyme family
MERTFPADEVASVTGVRANEWEAVETRGYARVCAHWRVRLADGRTAFVKRALTSEAVEFLRAERVLYESVSGSFMPAYFGTHDEEGTTLLVIEDLSEAEWPPPWSDDRIAGVLASLDALHETRPPSGLGTLASMRERIVGWGIVAEDPAPLVATGLCSRAWLDAALPELMRAGEAAELAGDELLHFDVRSDNLCFVDRLAVLVDWNLACVGNGRFDVAFWLPSLKLEGGPEPWEVLPDAGELAAAVAGFFAARTGLPPPSGAPTVREFQRAQASVALPWAACELGLPPPDRRR